MHFIQDYMAYIPSFSWETFNPLVPEGQNYPFKIDIIPSKCTSYDAAIISVEPTPESKKRGETTKRHYFVQPVTCFLFDEVFYIFFYKFTSVYERNLAFI